MASKTAKAVEPEKQGDDGHDSPLIDSTNQAVKKMLARAKERGYVTYDEINTALPQDKVSSEQIEDTMAMLSEMGVNVVENEESDDHAHDSRSGASSGASVPATTTSGTKAVTAPAKEELDRTDDPVRMYLREMGSIELLSRQGEIDIAKRIEAGREKMIGGICESPLTLDAIVQWRDELKSGTALLREIVDLDATYGKGPGSPGHGTDAAPGGPNAVPGTPGVANAAPGGPNAVPGTPGVANAAPGGPNAVPGTPGVANAAPGAGNGANTGQA
ncbi:MAG: RNA polymerase sigma factor RpoD, partial [Proteobacteria bacterium]|nr:RNA polymerase sigma factor RpoD [Pseudomonadota bacterium]